MDGILCIDKPQNFTSFDVVAKSRGILKQKKIGHAGTLDPMATGVLPLFLGCATRVCDILPDREKCYEAEFQLGVVTDTYDITGTVTERHDVTSGIKDVRRALLEFIGQIRQLPPMYSAVQIGGKRLYELARSGKEVERTARSVLISRLALDSSDPQRGLYRVTVECSAGTYIRSLVYDLGQLLGCGAVLTALRRTRANGFLLKQCITLGELQAIKDSGGNFPVIPVDAVFAAYPKTDVTRAQALRLLNGAPLDRGRLTFDSSSDPSDGAIIRVYFCDVFIGLGRLAEAQMKVYKLFTDREKAGLL